VEYNFDVRGYFNYYATHTYNVVLAWKDIQTALIENDFINEPEYEKIKQLIIRHDDSKISEEEFSGYGEKFYPLDNSNIDLDSFKKAWEHHKKNNLHHYQTLKEYNGSDKKCYLIEMICDWIAMGWETGTLAETYYTENKEQLLLSEEDNKIVNQVFSLIKENNCFSKGYVSDEDKASLYFK